VFDWVNRGVEGVDWIGSRVGSSRVSQSRWADAAPRNASSAEELLQRKWKRNNDQRSAFFRGYESPDFAAGIDLYHMMVASEEQTPVLAAGSGGVDAQMASSRARPTVGNARGWRRRDVSQLGRHSVLDDRKVSRALESCNAQSKRYIGRMAVGDVGMLQSPNCLRNGESGRRDLRDSGNASRHGWPMAHRPININPLPLSPSPSPAHRLLGLDSRTRTRTASAAPGKYLVDRPSPAAGNISTDSGNRQMAADYGQSSNNRQLISTYKQEIISRSRRSAPPT
jgi:hypothetical protein